MRILSIQQDLRPELPNIYSNIDYTQFRDTSERLSERKISDSFRYAAF